MSHDPNEMQDPNNAVPAGAVVPLFPLMDLILFPGVLLPLNIFEPRYKQMVGDLLDGNGLLVVGTVLDSPAESEAATVEPIAGVGRLENYQTLDDGRYLVLLRGLARVRLEEVESERMYRKVRVRPVGDEEPEPDPDLRERLLDAVRSRADGTVVGEPDQLATGRLADLLLMQLQLPPETLYIHYATAAVEARAHAALRLHEARPKGG